MKACKFCGTRVENAVTRCPSCGSSAFLNICENCGNQFESGFCPNCGVKAGQAKKVCPECKSVYFSNACPNCGYIPSRTPPVQEVIHKHVYVEPEHKPQPKPVSSSTSTLPEEQNPKSKKLGCGCLILVIGFVVFFGLVSSSGVNSSSKKSSTTATRKPIATMTATKNPGPTPTPDPEIVLAQELIDDYFEAQIDKSNYTPTPDPDTLTDVERTRLTVQAMEQKARNRTVIAKYAGSSKDRGRANLSGEPDYLGSIGYAVVGSKQWIEHTDACLKTPWYIPIYQKDKQFWEQSGKIEHKTKVVVIEQSLEKPKSSRSKIWSGYLHVIQMDNKEDYYLDVSNFVASAYWNYSLTEAIETGFCLAEYKQVSDYYPVTKGNEKAELEDGMLILLPMKSTSYATSPDKTNNPITGIAFKEWRLGYGGVDTFFNLDDLTLVY